MAPIKYPELWDASFVKHLYCDKRLSAAQMAEVVGCSASTAWVSLSRAGIEPRPVRAAQHLRQSPDPDLVLSETAVSFIEGELLGDGYLRQRSPWSARYQHGSKHESYLVWLSEQMRSFGLEQGGRLQAYSGPKVSAPYWAYASRNYPALLGLRLRWYPDGTKVVPDDLVLSPLTARQWYLGDGYRSRSGWEITFATHGFAPHGRSVLVSRLGELGVEATVQGTGALYVRARSHEALFDYMGPCPPEIENIYGYKWPEGES